MAKSKKERRSSIRHMGATDDSLKVLEALERMEQQERPAESQDAERDDTEKDPAPGR